MWVVRLEGQNPFIVDAGAFRILKIVGVKTRYRKVGGGVRLLQSRDFFELSRGVNGESASLQGHGKLIVSADIGGAQDGGRFGGAQCGGKLVLGQGCQSQIVLGFEVRWISSHGLPIPGYCGTQVLEPMRSDCSLKLDVRFGPISGTRRLGNLARILWRDGLRRWRWRGWGQNGGKCRRRFVGDERNLNGVYLRARNRW